MKKFSICTFIFSILTVFSINCFAGITQTGTDSINRMSIRPEHVAFNVADHKAMAKWYTENLDMIVIRKVDKPDPTLFIADSEKHIMLELIHSTEYPVIDLFKIKHMSFHLGFVVKDLKATKEKLLKKKATLAEDIKTTISGDQVLMLRDPWGLPIQFVQRVKPLIKFKNNRLEHFSINLDNSAAKAKWYTENLGMKVLRELETQNNSFFMSDRKENFTFELYQNKDYPVIKFDTVNASSFHLGFMANDLELLKADLLKAGATIFEDIHTHISKDKILLMRDPWGLPIQFVKRTKNMID